MQLVALNATVRQAITTRAALATMAVHHRELHASVPSNSHGVLMIVTVRYYVDGCSSPVQAPGHPADGRPFRRPGPPMSAICGAVGLDGRPYRAADLAGMLSTLAPLGPDGGGSWAGAAGPLGVAVGMLLRQRVPEDRADQQPVTSADGRVTVVADAVLDNRRDLCRRLDLRDRPDLPDSALVLAAYQRWGEACPARLIGEFAFAAVDRGRGGVLLARDHLGARPLHLHTRPGVLAFASTALALTDFDGVGHDLDTARLTEVLGLKMFSERSWVAGVRPVPPAATLWVDGAGVRSRVYWQLDPSRVDTALSGDGHVQALRAALDEAVAARLRGPGAVGIALSGGLDSTSVAATVAARLAPAPVHTYTSVPPPGWAGVPRGRCEPDESHLVTELAERYPNLRPTFVDARGASFLDGFDEIFAAGGTPPQNSCNLTWFRPSWRDAAAKGVRTFLTGAGGNLFFSADDPRWLIALLRRGRLGTAAREARAWAASTGEPFPRVVRSAVLAEATPVAVRRWHRRHQGGNDPVTRLFSATALRPEWRADLDMRAATVFADERSSRAVREHGLAALLQLAGHAEFFAAEQARWGFRLTDPTADVRLIEVCATQPAWVRRRAGQSRAACREAMAGRLPDSIRLRTARGDQLPDWFDRMTDARAELTAEFAAIREHPLVREFIDVEALGSALRHWPEPTPQPDDGLLRTYRLALLRALLVGRYVRWFTERSRQPRQC